MIFMFQNYFVDELLKWTPLARPFSRIVGIYDSRCRSLFVAESGDLFFVLIFSRVQSPLTLVFYESASISQNVWSRKQKFQIVWGCP